MQYEDIRAELGSHPRRWLVTGCAGFIGSNLLEALLNFGQQVVGLDNFSTGYRHNLEDVRASVDAEAWSRFRFIEGDIRDRSACSTACTGIDYVLHHAALGSVPRSINDPMTTNDVNVVGFLNMLVAARDVGVRRFVYAASSSTYGDYPDLPKVEDRIGSPLSPYAVTKYVDELYAQVFGRAYGIDTVGLRYFNVFGRRQDTNGAYAAVIPKWVGNLLEGRACVINGDGESSRDFCYIDNVVQANLLAATAIGVAGDIFNVAVGARTSLNALFFAIQDGLAHLRPDLSTEQPRYAPFRSGDIRHSQADISKAQKMLGYQPTHWVEEGLKEALGWYVDNLHRLRASLEPVG